MALNLITPPTLDAVSLAEFKEQLRVDIGDTSQDNVLIGHLKAGQSFVEGFLNRKCMQQTWALLIDFFPGYIDLKLAGARVSSPFVSGSNAVLVGIRYAIVLEFPPVQSILNFEYQDANGNVTVMNPGTDYIIDIQSNPARLTPPFGKMWPVARVVVNAVQIQYTVGYAIPLVVSTQGSPPNLNKISAIVYSFIASDLGRPISIEGAGVNSGTLNTIVTGVSSPPDSNASIADAMTAPILNGNARLVNALYGNPNHWCLIKQAIMAHAEGRWRRVAKKIYEDEARGVCYQARDIRF